MRVQSSPRRPRLPGASAVYYYLGRPRDFPAASAELIQSDPPGTGDRIWGSRRLFTRSYVENGDGPALLEPRPQLVRSHSRAPPDTQNAVPPGTAQRCVQEERDNDDEHDSEAEMKRGLGHCLAHQVSEAHPRAGPEHRADRAVDKEARDTFAGRPGKVCRDGTQFGQEPRTQAKHSFVIMEEGLTPLNTPSGGRREARDQYECPGSPPSPEAVPHKVRAERGHDRDRHRRHDAEPAARDQRADSKQGRNHWHRQTPWLAMIHMNNTHSAFSTMTDAIMSSGSSLTPQTHIGRHDAVDHPLHLVTADIEGSGQVG